MSTARITKGDVTYALVVTGSPVPANGVQFFTEQTDPFQAGVMERPAGYEVKPHAHPPVQSDAASATEFLYIERGKIQVKIYDPEWNVLHKGELQSGDFVIFFAGGHSLNVLEDCRMIEVKQGPYPGSGKAKVFADIPH